MTNLLATSNVLTSTMKQLLQHITIAFFLLGSVAFNPLQAQKAKYKIADTYFRAFDYSNAAMVYEDILEKHPDDTIALRQAASCYTKMRKSRRAEEKLRAMSLLPAANPEDLFAFAEALRMNKKYGEAIEVYEKLKTILPDDPAVEQYLEDPQLFNKIQRDSTRYNIRGSAVNSDKSDFGVCILENGEVIFSSSRAEGKGSGRIYSWNNQSYLNLFSTHLAADSTLEGTKVEGRELNTRFHEGTVALDKSTNQLYITRNNVDGNNSSPSASGDLNLGIFFADRDGDQWGDFKPFKFNNKEYSVGHPSISEDGKKMYFVSDMAGGIGGADIWMCEKDGEGWGEPKNLGFKINTPGNEMFPFVLGNRLFFSSDGHPGLGGLDMFHATFDGATLYQVLNMGYPANSSYDDFSIVLFEGAKRGFFASNRSGGVGDDDIYEILISPPKTLRISGKVVDDESNEFLDGATLVLEKLLGKDDGTLLATSDENGNFEVEIPYASSLELKALKQLYFPETIELNPDALSGYIDNVEIRLKKFDYAVEGKVMLAETNKPTAGATVKLLDKAGNVLEEQVTAADGRYFFILEEDEDYSVEASLPEYLTLSENVSTKGKEKGITYIDFTLFKPEKGTVVRLNNIYYDYNSAAIRQDAARELDRLVKILQDNPTMKIELGSHSDARGSDSYNLSLSQKRAKSAVDYLISQGIAKARLVSKGYGETQIKNRCVNGVECTDAEHEENRRTEFIILDI